MSGPAHVPDRQPPARGALQRWTFLTLLVVIGYLFWLVAKPLWVPLFLGALVAISLHPLHLKLFHKLKGKRREAISAGVLTGSGVVLGSASVAVFAIVVLGQLLSVIRTFAERLKHETPAQLLGPRWTGLLASVGENPDELQKRLAEASSSLAGNLGQDAAKILAASFGLILICVFTTLTAYSLLRHGKKFTTWFVGILPLPDGEVWELVRNFRDVARVMLLGTGVTAVYQGAVSTLGYWIGGVPHPVVWGALTGLASLLPSIGTTMIWAPVVAYLMLTDHVAMGVMVLLWSGFLVVGVADYVLRPRLLGNKVKMNDLVIFIALFGGIEAFGLLGIILGPIVAALLVAMLQIYQRDYRPLPAGEEPKVHPRRVAEG